MAMMDDPSPRVVRDYEDLERAGEAAGFSTHVDSYGYNDGIGFGTGAELHSVFWAGRRAGEAVLSLPPPHGVYRLADPARLREACVAIMGRLRALPEFLSAAYNLRSAHLRAVRAETVPRWFDADFEREFGLIAITWFEWHALEQDEKTRRLAGMGWWRVPKDEHDALHDRVVEAFHPGGMPMQKIRVPDGARGFDIDAAFVDDATTQRLGKDLTVRTLDALRKVTRPGERLYAKALPSFFWSFDPHADITEAELDTLPVSFLPDVDRNYVLAPDFRFGLLGRCPEPRMYVFGAELIAAFGDDWPEAFTALP